MNKIQKKTLIKNTARDLIALGSIPFFILVLARIYILAQPDYFIKITFSGFLFIILSFIFKTNIYSGLGLITGFFLSYHYKDIKFTIFSILAYILLITSLIYLKESKKKIFFGILLGVIASLISFIL